MLVAWSVRWAISTVHPTHAIYPSQSIPTPLCLSALSPVQIHTTLPLSRHGCPLVHNLFGSCKLPSVSVKAIIYSHIRQWFSSNLKEASFGSRWVTNDVIYLPRTASSTTYPSPLSSCVIFLSYRAWIMAHANMHVLFRSGVVLVIIVSSLGWPVAFDSYLILFTTRLEKRTSLTAVPFPGPWVNEWQDGHGTVFFLRSE